MRTILLSLWMLAGLCQLSYAQQAESLDQLSDEQLLTMFDEVIQDSLAAERVARIYLDRARKEKDTIKMARGYDRLARIFSLERNIQFADSVITLTADLNHITYPALGYILRGYNFQLGDDLVNCTRNYLEAYKLSIQNENSLQQVYLLDKLIYKKAIWGNRIEALKLQKRRDELVQDKNYIEKLRSANRIGVEFDVEEILLNDFIVSSENYAFIYYNMRRLDSARVYLKEALKLLENYKGEHLDYHRNWVIEFQMELEYIAENYKESIRIGDSIISGGTGIYMSSSLFNAYMIAGLSRTKMLNNYESGLTMMLKADSIFSTEKIRIQPYKRELFDTLLGYYRSIDDDKSQMKYLSRLITFDSIMRVNYQYFEPELIKELETNELIAQKQELLARLNRNKRVNGIKIGVLFGFVLLSCWALVYYYRKHVLYRKRYESLKSNSGPTARKSKMRRQEISDEVIREILDRLEQFERKKAYLSADISLNSIARSFGTNAKYLSSVINLNKGKNFSQYINSLRTQYAFDRLREDRMFQRYTIRAVAGESGFNRAESFSKAFYRNFGIYPSYYIKKLEKDELKTTPNPAEPLAD
ncbi:helix-turn-helix domain-containing protein [Aureitalea marina]|nr:helix-turn-helix domain-containing protein [Aureitalea marina]